MDQKCLSHRGNFTAICIAYLDALCSTVVLHFILRLSIATVVPHLDFKGLFHYLLTTKISPS